MPSPRPIPARDIRLGLILGAIFFIGLLGWAAIARLDAAAIAPGRLVVSGQRQTVQHRDGGVVADIAVKEGDSVRQGQILIQPRRRRSPRAGTRAGRRRRSPCSPSARGSRPRPRAARAIIPPPEFAELTGEDRLDATRSLQVQQGQLADPRRGAVGAARGDRPAHLAGRRARGSGYSRQVVAVDEQLRLIDEELNALRGVAEKGFVSKTRVRALERQKAELEGQRGQFAATVAQTGSQQGETRLQILETQNNYYERIATELRDVENALADARPKWAAARDQLARIDIRAPATGTVVGLTVFTRGGVISAGQKLMDIVPDRAPLTIEARLSPEDADDVRVGQKAFVRFATLHESSLPALNGERDAGLGRRFVRRAHRRILLHHRNLGALVRARQDRGVARRRRAARGHPGRASKSRCASAPRCNMRSSR